MNRLLGLLLTAWFLFLFYGMAQACQIPDCDSENMTVRATIINLTHQPFDEAILYCYDHMMQCPNICEKAAYEDQVFACQQYYLCCEHVDQEALGIEQNGFIVVE
jgi:hypothetical protein